MPLVAASVARVPTVNSRLDKVMDKPPKTIGRLRNRNLLQSRLVGWTLGHHISNVNATGQTCCGLVSGLEEKW
jgi:hypothetical protein